MGEVDIKYTTKDKKLADPIKEAGKIELTNEGFAVAEFLEKILNALWRNK